MASSYVTVADVTVTTAGTRVPVSATATPIQSIIFQAHNTATGRMYIGDSSVSATQGVYITAGQTLTISAEAARNGGGELILSDFYVDSSVNGEKVKVSYIKVR